MSKLAIDGGEKIRSAPWPPRRLFGQAEKQAVVDLFDRCIESGQPPGYNGPEEEAFCREFAAAVGGGFADAVNSGTNAVYVALRSLELPPFSEVIVPPITDPGGVMPVALVNCIPVPADSAPDSYNTDAGQIRRRLTRRTCAIVVAHIAGIPVNMPPIVQLAREHNLAVVEDCAQALGATCHGQPVGSFGDVAAFSTMFGKHITTGGQGGVVFTRDEQRYWNIRRMADRGKPFGLAHAGGNVVAALNCNMDELHAAIGRAQLPRLPEIVARRRELALAIAAGCEEQLHTVRMVSDPPFGQASFWFLFFRLELERITVDKGRFVQALAAEGLPFEPGYMWCPTRAPWFGQQRVYADSHLPWSHPLYAGPSAGEYAMPNIEATDACHFRMTFHENLTQQDIDDVLAALRKVEAAYRR